jgi:hypothetical protein
MRLFEEYSDATYSVAWIDCLADGTSLGRSAIMLGEHAAAWELPGSAPSVAFSYPAQEDDPGAVRRPAGAAESGHGQGIQRGLLSQSFERSRDRLVDWDSYFYPLDAPSPTGTAFMAGAASCIPVRAAAGSCTRRLWRSCSGPFPRAVKARSSLCSSGLGAMQAGAFSFPMEGYTLALDFPGLAADDASSWNRLDRIVVDHDGRFYLAKDSRMTAQTLRASDERVSDFVAQRQHLGATAFQSSQSERLQL